MSVWTEVVAILGPCERWVNVEGSTISGRQDFNRERWHSKWEDDDDDDEWDEGEDEDSEDGETVDENDDDLWWVRWMCSCFWPGEMKPRPQYLHR